MAYKTLKIAGSLAMASAFLTLPLAYFSFMLEGKTDSYANEIQTFMQVFGTLIFVAILLSLKKVLNTLFTFTDTDKNIDLMVMASMVTGSLTIGMFSFPTLKDTLVSVVVVILVIQGIIQVQFGYKLLKLPNDLGGMLKPFCYTTVATGILMATVVLIPVGIVTSALSDLMLGTIFFNLSKRMRSNEEP